MRLHQQAIEAGVPSALMKARDMGKMFAGCMTAMSNGRNGSGLVRCRCEVTVRLSIVSVLKQIPNQNSRWCIVQYADGHVH